MTRRVNLKPDRNPYAVDEPPSDFATETRQLEDPKLARPLIRRKSQKPRTKRNKTPEHDLQKHACQELAERLHDSVIWFHVPNEAKRSYRQAALLTEIGMLAGVPDLVLMWVAADGLRETAWIEMKAGKNEPTDDQATFLKRAAALGHYTAVCRSMVDVMGKLSDWRVPMRKVK